MGGGGTSPVPAAVNSIQDRGSRLELTTVELTTPTIQIIKDYSASAARRTSITVCGLEEPTLLLNQARAGTGQPRAGAVLGRAGQERHGALGIELTQFLTPNALDCDAGSRPGLDPEPALGDLFRRPVRKWLAHTVG